jgi:Family of unknown function (DUF6064)
MKLPFTTEQFLDVFSKYNESIWPLQIFFYFSAVYCIYSVFRRTAFSHKLVFMFLVFIWLWMGVVYNIIFFASINTAAYLFGSLFILQALVFVYEGLIENRLMFEFTGSIYNYAGALHVIFALAVYPLLGFILGHRYPQSPTFGLPCPTTIFTLGIILFIRGRIPLLLIAIPLLWSVIGFTAAFTLDIYEDTGLLAAGLISITLVVFKNRKLLNE